MEEKRKIAIVGTGLGGVTVGYHLLIRGCDVTFFDNGVNHSSRIAAGMINPIVFRRMNKGWRVDDLLPYLQTFYRHLEKETNSSFFHPVNIRRLFSSDQERGYWYEKQNLPEYKAYLYEATEDDENYNLAKNLCGTGRLKQAFYIQTHEFLMALNNYIAKKGNVVREQFDHALLSNTSYRGITYDEIVFCEGYHGKNNPWFNNLPLIQTKGETLTVKAQSLPAEESLNRKCFMLPLGGHHFKVGSTYDWNNTDLAITEEGKETILEKIRFITDEEVEVLQQEAGIRPTTSDRRPLIGTHPTKKHYHIFNGLGTKGYQLAPLLSKEFVDYLLDNKPLDKEVNIARFIKD